MSQKPMKTATLLVKSACSEGWDEMQPAINGRFCGSCQKTVIDFSTMSENEIIHFFENYQGGGLCGKIRADQQGKTYSVGKPIKLSYARQIWKVAAVSAGLIMNLSQPLVAQTFDNHLIQSSAVVVQNMPDEEKTVSLRLEIWHKYKGGKQVFQNCEVEIWQKDGLVIAKAKTDENGRVEFKLTDEQWGEGVYLYNFMFKKRYFLSNAYRNKSKKIMVKLLQPPPPPPPLPLMPPLLGILEYEPAKESEVTD